MIANKRFNTKFAWKYQRYKGFSAGIREQVKSFMVFVTILCLCLKSASEIVPSKTTSNGVVINSELAVLPEKLCCIWTATRDLKQRKYNYPFNYRYGVNLLIHRKLFHVILLILLAGDVATNPGPFSAQGGHVKSLVLNARSLKSIQRDKQSSQVVCNLQRFQDLVYSENSDVICVNETWLNSTVSDNEILHSGFSIFRKDRKERSGGGVLIAVKTDSFKTVKEFSLDEYDLQELEIVSTELRTMTDKKILYCCCYRPPDANQCWMDKFKTYLQTICDLYENIIMAGDFNLPNINWDALEITSGVNELVFVELLNDHYLSQLVNTPTRGNNILDLVITNMPDLVSLTRILPPEEHLCSPTIMRSRSISRLFLNNPGGLQEPCTTMRGATWMLCVLLYGKLICPQPYRSHLTTSMSTGRIGRRLFCLLFQNSYQKRKFVAGIRFHGLTGIFCTK